MGHISKKPRWHVYNGQRMLCFPLITTEKLKQSLHEEWHQIRIHERLVNLEKLDIGMLVYVQGRLQTKQLVDENQIKHYRSEVIAISIEPMNIDFLAV